MKVTIIGLGLIGGSLALDLRASGFARIVTGVDQNETHVRQALERGFVDQVLSLDAALDAELVILAVPVHAIVRLLPGILDRIGPETTVTDMGSTKSLIARAVATHPKRSQFVASHPMAGTENSGPMAALSDLFAHKTGVICDRELSGPAHLARVEEMYRALRMRLVYMSAQNHDVHTAYVSHLSHISSFVLANTVLDKEKDVGTIFDLAGGGFESTVRLGKSSPEMWNPIFEQNHDNVVQALSAYIEHLQDFHKSLVDRRFEKTRELMENANQIRRVLEKMSNRSAQPEKKS